MDNWPQPRTLLQMPENTIGHRFRSAVGGQSGQRFGKWQIMFPISRIAGLEANSKTGLRSARKQQPLLP
ncbi:hypothetical protein EGJ57_08900 [Brucella anthropi]|nr:hypothetical protein EGJ57_08900 [Brucella anthropi]